MELEPAETRACRTLSRSTAVGWLALVGGLGLPAAPLAATPAHASVCAPRTYYKSSPYTVCSFDVRRDDVRLSWADAQEKPFGGFAALAQSLAAHGRTLRFAMNAGMYGADLSPVGLYIEDGKRLRRADTRAGVGASNFHLQPNGVFWIGDGVAGVTETSRFLADPPADALCDAIGADLVIDGRIHPQDSARPAPRRRSATASACATARRRCSSSRKRR